ncbi:Transcription factor steA [Choanephora cucurbitarum]|uniref:Transcription factor steA n=1 Tax=Choanephora cucurbitarum TaxID=101091 RepID=A0A1C7MYG8_9FUNG|nr:Transcription factor steA [Choanephora cucurbitarum]
MIPSQDNLQVRLEMIDQLKSFLVTAPNNQNETIKQHHLPNGDIVSCVKWNNGFFISGTDIVRSLVFRFQAFGRPVDNVKKFEEGIFSDLRNLKPGTDAILEEPKSPFLDLLFKNNCIRTQKKQKVFYWFSVPHDRLFLDALERDLKREKMGVEPTSRAVAHPAMAISLDTTQAMFDEFRKAMLCELNLDSFYHPENDEDNNNNDEQEEEPMDLQKASSTLFGQFSLFEGSPTYKQRKRRVTPLKKRSTTYETDIKIKPATSTEETVPLRHFDCPVPSCGKIFKRLEHMKRHLRTHTLERPYLCDMCGKRFSRSDNLAQHKKTHERAKPLTTETRRRRDKGLTKAYSRTSNNNGRSVTISRNTSHHSSINTRRMASPFQRRPYNRHQPSLSHSASTTSSSCPSSPELVQNDNDYETMMLTEEFLSLRYQEKEDEEEEHESDFDDWQRKIDWNQYSAPPSPAIDPALPVVSTEFYPLCYYDFLMTPIESGATTAANSPLLHLEDDFYHYSDESPTISPTDALLQPF